MIEDQDSISDVKVASQSVDHSPWSHSLQEKFESAQSIIARRKSSAEGYLQMGELYRAQGKQQRAIEICETGLLCVSSDDTNYAQLVDAKAKAIEQNSSRVNFITVLPLEVLQEIFVKLSKESKTSCLCTSSAWRNILLNCAPIWDVMTTNDNDSCFAAVLPHIAMHVKDLRVDGEDSQIWPRYMDHLAEGSFTRIKALHLRGVLAPYIPSSLIYSRVKDTLTKLTLDTTHIPIETGIAGILYTCTKLTQLVLRGEGLFSDVAGDFTIFETYQHPLQDLKIDCSTTGKSIEPLLQQCQKIQRLLVERGKSSILNVVYSTCQNVRIFALGPLYKFVELGDVDGSDGRPGLQMFYTNSEDYSISLQDVFALMRKSMNTLRMIVINTCVVKAPNSSYNDLSDQSYGDFQLPNLQQLSYTSHSASLFQDTILRYISTFTSLRALKVDKIKTMEPIARALMAIPPVEELDLSFDSSHARTQGSIQLFQYYATYSRTHTVRFSFCNSMPDEVFDALGDITSLRNIDLNWTEGSEDALDRLLRKISDSVTSLDLTRIGVRDHHLAIIGTMPHLTKVSLTDLYYITTAGILKMISSFDMLEYLSITDSFRDNLITDEVEAIADQHAKKHYLFSDNYD